MDRYKITWDHLRSINGYAEAIADIDKLENKIRLLMANNDARHLKIGAQLHAAKTQLMESVRDILAEADQ